MIQRFKRKRTKNYLDMFGEHYEYIENDKCIISIYSTPFEEFNSFSVVNGIILKDGGTHINYLAREISNAIKDKLAKKYKTIKLGDIKNKLFIVCIIKDMKDLKFASQTKTSITNSESQIKKHIDIDLETFTKNILKNKEIIDPIVDIFKIKQEFENRKALKEMSKPVKKLRIEKYKPAINKEKYLIIGEGVSATNAIIAAIGREETGAYPLKGKPLNAGKATITQIKNNEESEAILQILGVDLSSKKLDILVPNYENLIIAADADLDGHNIVMLFLTFFMKYYPEFIKQNRMKRLKTPIIIAYVKNKPFKPFFTIEEYNEWSKKNIKHVPEYKKGLSSLDDSEFEWLFENGVEQYIETLEWSEDVEVEFDIWMGDDSEKRKAKLKGAIFDLSAL